MMPPPSDDLHNVFLADRSEDIPDKNNITVRGILEKNQTAAAIEVKVAAANLPTNSTDVVLSASS